MPRCKCRECYGLREYLEERGLNTRGLQPMPGCDYTRGQLATVIACTGGYTCKCDKCKQSQQRLLEHRRKYGRPQ